MPAQGHCALRFRPGKAQGESTQRSALMANDWLHFDPVYFVYSTSIGSFGTTFSGLGESLRFIASTLGLLISPLSSASRPPSPHGEGIGRMLKKPRDEVGSFPVMWVLFCQQAVMGSWALVP